MLNLIKKIKKKLKKIIYIKKIKKITKMYKKLLGKKGYFNNIMKLFHNIPNKKKPKIGNIINILKKKTIKLINKQKLYINKKKKKNKKFIDISLPGNINILYGNLHPITITINWIENFFNELGFKTINNSEIENIYYNFDSLNINKNHPSRSNKDTFWINKKKLLITQTSCIQIKYMKKNKPPIKVISIGNVFRKDYDKTHTPMFHQIEIFIVDYNINFCNLIYIIKNFLNIFFNKKIKLKIVTSYFPFTEPSAEIYIKNHKNKWIEIIGCGLIHPKILKNSNINNNIFSGLAFGIGIERLTMIKYKICNIKKLYENNIEWLNQF